MFILSLFCPEGDGFDMDQNGEGGEEEEEEDDIDMTEVQRRRERLEREQWLREQVSLTILHNSTQNLIPIISALPVILEDIHLHFPTQVTLLSAPVLRQSEQKAKKGEDLDDERMGEEDSQFMRLAKKFTAKTLQKKGLSPANKFEVHQAKRRPHFTQY